MQMKIEKSGKVELTLQNTKCIPTSDGMSSTILSPRGSYTLNRPTVQICTRKTFVYTVLRQNGASHNVYVA